MACPRIDTCALFPQFVLRQNKRFWQANYCEADFELCARYQRGNAGEEVPDTLLPDGKHIRIVIDRRDVSDEV